MVTATIPARWTPLKFHPVQRRLWTSPARFKVVEAGRRSGKTELAKRRGVLDALNAPADIHDFRVAYCAPTRDQAKDIYWEDLKALTPPELVDRVYETELTIKLVNGARVSVVGMDKPARIEGKPVDRAFVDEYADMKPLVWERHLRPALDTIGRPGTAWIYGVPRPSADFKSRADQARADEEAEWEYFHWTSSEILPAEVVEAARRDLDPLTFAQEYEASRVNLQGLAYYPFRSQVHAKDRLEYTPHAPLIFCFDFNVEPGVAVVVQEQRPPEGREDCAEIVSGVIGQVHIPRNSNTPAVVRRLLEDWGEHPHQVWAYGDATGGARGTAQVEGSDWEIIYSMLRTHYRERLSMRNRRKNPPERVRVNAVNSRLLSADGRVSLLIDPWRAPDVLDDFENTVLLDGGSGEIDKKANPAHTHMTDALGYYLQDRFPIITNQAREEVF